ncbi:MAG: DUF5361 domain-containing protein [Actinobacteria bacterium]|nr:DUF5361 domain-containing protein [Actinomycetota bacterium]
MGEGVGVAGGILGLYGLVEQHREAIDYDLLTLGLDLGDLGTPRLDWSRLRAVVVYSPATSALASSMHGDAASWSVSDHLLAAAVDALNAGNWQRGGGKGRRPKPVARPGEKPKDQRRFGTGKMSLSQAQAFFARINRPEPVRAAEVEASCTAEGCSRPVHARGMCSMHYKRWWRQSRSSP